MVLAGLLANIALAILGGLVIRAGVTGELGTFALAWLIVNAYMFGFQLMPVPGFDGAKLLAPFLPPRPREVFVNAEQYLVLFILVIFFILSGPLLSIVERVRERGVQPGGGNGLPRLTAPGAGRPRALSSAAS